MEMRDHHILWNTIHKKHNKELQHIINSMFLNATEGAAFHFLSQIYIYSEQTRINILHYFLLEEWINIGFALNTIFLPREWDNHRAGDISSGFLWNPLNNFITVSLLSHVTILKNKLKKKTTRNKPKAQLSS